MSSFLQRIAVYFTCNKATTKYAGREYTAWYTLDVPISYGPYKFFGLPGLIIKIEESTGMYIWEMYSLSVSATPIHIYQYEKEQKCTEESAARTIHRMMTTPMTFLSSAGSRVLVRQNDGSFGSPAKDEKFIWAIRNRNIQSIPGRIFSSSI